MPEFHFVVPVLSREIAGKRWFHKDNPDGRNVEFTLNNCLESLLNQTVDSIVIHLIIHDLPPLREHIKNSDKIIIHDAGFPTPKKIDLATYNRVSGKVLPFLPGMERRKVNDKYSKFKVGLKAAFEDPESEFVMLVDGDDMVHKDLVAFCMENKGKPECAGGHTITQGYNWALGTNYLRKVFAFHKSCGTCNIVRIVDEEREQYLKTRYIDCFNRRQHWLYAAHTQVFQRIRNLGRGTTKVTFPAALYVTNTGNNISGTRAVGTDRYEFTPKLREAFGLQNVALPGIDY